MLGTRFYRAWIVIIFAMLLFSSVQAQIPSEIHVEKAHFEQLPWIDVTHSTYGADGSDTLDDSGAFQDAFEAAADIGGTVFIPAGVYYIDSTVEFKNTSGSTSIDGIQIWASEGAQILGRNTTLDLFDFSNVRFLTWRGGEFSGNANAVFVSKENGTTSGERAPTRNRFIDMRF